MGTIEPGYIGFLAGFGTTFAALPDLITMLRRRSVDGMKPRMAAITAAFQIVWIYGLLIDSTTVVLWNMIAVVSNALTVAAYFYFLRRAQPAAPATEALAEPENIY